ncbi:peptidylprolyl isomerase [Taibaiella chishuiensis]|uniref:Periplasmic chaperone PpiD n=1 Tax=Taibaiella chishuiensis TaxID=1434707 RepID=A0A2P8DB19_9BACT|nr:peptidylprolyl isomerase [Taibaiella chishuiensis]PSK94399.1 peptidyl-prolyl cis-trans isomerase D [Taibaiella chishuiensis]
MAIIQKIRDKYAKLAGGVIVLALVGFILMDYGKGGRTRSTTIGKIDGKKIDYTEYEARVQQRENEIKAQNPSANIDDNNQAQIRDQVWNQLVNEQLLSGINDKLGIIVSKAELNDLLTGPNPDPTVKQAFTNRETGVFNPQEAAAQIQQIKKDPNMKDNWAAFEADLVKRRYASKFNALVAGAMYVPKFMVDDQAAARNTLANINYVKLPYSLIADDQVKVTDAEIKEYMEAHKAMFQIKDPSRSAEYVSFTVVPSHDDSARSLGDLEKIKTEFATTTDIETFVNKNSENPMPANFFTKTQLQGLPNVDELMNAAAGTVVGPFYDGNSFMLARIEERKTLPDSVKCRHILVKTSEGGKPVMSDSAAKARIDSVMAMAKAGVPFDTLVQRYSQDEGSKGTHGEYDFQLAQRASISKEFGDFIFEGATGSDKIVKVENPSYGGYHYIEILKQAAPAPVSKIAFVSKQLTADKNTYDAIYSQASQFASKATNGAAFDKEAKALGLNPAPADGLNENSSVVNGLGSSREMVKWAYDAKVGDVSQIFTIGDRYIVAKLNGIMPAGLAPINAQTRPQLEVFVKRVKKAKMLMDRSKGKGSLEAIATSENQQVAVADSINFLQAMLPNAGQELKVVGYAFNKAFKENTMSPAIAGQDGVFYLTVRSRAALTAERNEPIERQMMEGNLKANAGAIVTNGLRETAEVKDMRGSFYQ